MRVPFPAANTATTSMTVQVDEWNLTLQGFLSIKPAFSPGGCAFKGAI